MVKATANCKCKQCGEIFEVQKIVRNTKERENWEEWAVNGGDDTCPKCYGLKKSTDEITTALKNGNEIKAISYKEYKNNYQNYKTIPNSYNAQEKTIKVIIPNYDKKIKLLDEFFNNLDYDKKELDWLNITTDKKIIWLKQLEKKYSYINVIDTWTKEVLFAIKKIKGEQ